jgi:hypothetical protein
MASIIYDSVSEDMAEGNLDFDTHSFYAMLTSSSYTESKSAHSKRSDVTNEVVGAGYVSGGIPVSVTVARVGSTTTITLGSAVFTGVSVTARKCVYYRSRGGAATADELVGCNECGSDLSGTNVEITVNASSIQLVNNS